VINSYKASGFRLQASGFRLQASGFRLQASGFRLQASGFRPYIYMYKKTSAIEPDWLFYVILKFFNYFSQKNLKVLKNYAIILKCRGKKGIGIKACR
jgi:hypothetical protein